MKAASRFAVVFTLFATTFLSGCALDEDHTAEIASDREKSKVDWKLEVEWAGSSQEMPIERMDIYLVEDEEYPEVFDIHGEDLALVGEFPLDLHVDYEEKLERLVGRPITIAPSGGDPGDLKQSFVTLGGMRVPVLGGTFTVEKLSGKWEGSEGNKTVSGTIELRIPSADGETTVRGRFSSHAVTWG